MDILLRLVAQGTSQFVGSMNQAGSATENVGTQANRAANGTGELNRGLDETRTNAQGAAGGLNDAAQGADRLDDEAQGATGATNGLSASLEKARNVGLAMAAVGAGGLAITESLVEGYIEADRLNGKMDSLMRAKGLESAIEDVQKLGGEIAGLTGGDDDGISTSIAAAIASGKVNGLKEYGIIIDANGQAAIAAAGKISAQAKSQEVLNQVMRAGAAAVDSMRASMDESTASLGEFSVRWGNIEEGIGAGAADAKAAIIEGVLSPILSVIEASPDLQHAAGYFSYFGSAGLSVVGSLLAVGSQIGMTMVGFTSMGVTGVGAWTAIRTAAMSAGAATWAAIAPLIPLIAAVAAVALIAAGAMYLLDKAWNYKEDQELAANIKAGEEADPEVLENVNKSRRKKGQKEITLEQLRAWQNDDSGEMTDPLAEQSAKPNMGAADIDAMSAKLAALQSGNMGAAPAMPTAPQTAPAPVVLAPQTAAAIGQAVKAKPEKPAATKTARSSTKALVDDDDEPSSTKPTKAVSSTNDAFNVLSFLRGGGSLYGADEAAKAREKQGKTGDEDSSTKPRTGTLKLRESGRQTRAGDGRETVAITGTLELSGGGASITALEMGFRE